MHRKVVVTGASGHIGFHVARLLLETGEDVHLLIRTENRNTVELAHHGAKLLRVDLANPSTYRDALQGADALFHLAAENTTATHEAARVIANTADLTRTVLDAAADGGVKTIIYTSSVVVLGRSPDPAVLLDENSRTGVQESPYVLGKFLAEQYCDELIRSRNVDLRRLYPSWVIGNNDCKGTPPHKVIRDYVRKGQRFYFRGGISVASVETVARAHVNAWLNGQPNGKYVVAGDNITFQQFYSILARHAGHRPPALPLPKSLVFLAAAILKVILGKKNPVDPKYVQSVFGNFSWYNSQKAITELGYSVPDADSLLREAVVEAKRKNCGLDRLYPKHNPSLQRRKYAEDDRLLMTGFPGWLGNRMIDVFMNGDRFGRNAIHRKVRLLVQPAFRGMIALPPEFEIVYGDITDRNSLSQALEGVKAVYHLAGVIYPPRISTFARINYEGTRNLVDACIAAGTRRFLFMGTDSICGYGRATRIFDEQTPSHPYKNYGQSKYLAEKYVLDKTREGKLDGTSLRGFWFFGPFMPPRNRGFFEMFRWKRQLVFGNGKNYRSISHVDNTISAFLKAEKSPATIGHWYWIGDRKADYTVNELYAQIADAMGTHFRPLYVPKFVCELLSVCDNAISFTGRLNATIHAAGKFHKDIAGDVSAAIRDFGYQPDVSLAEIKREIPSLLENN